MNLLLDENLPERLINDLPGHYVTSVRQRGWQNKANGELIRLMTMEKIDALITFDQNLPNQQNLKKNQLIVLVLLAHDNTYAVIRMLAPYILEKLVKKPDPGAYFIEKN